MCGYVETFPNPINFNVNVNARHGEILFIPFLLFHVCTFKSLDDNKKNVQGMKQKNELTCELSEE